MAQLQVSTVHSFCERVLRQHAVEADIDPDFSVLADDEVELLRKQAINLAFAEMAATEASWLEAMPRYTRLDLQQYLKSRIRQAQHPTFCAQPEMHGRGKPTGRLAAIG